MDCIRDGIHGSSRLGSASSSRPRPNGPESDRSGLLNQTQLSLYTNGGSISGPPHPCFWQGLSCRFH